MSKKPSTPQQKLAAWKEAAGKARRATITFAAAALRMWDENGDGILSKPELLKYIPYEPDGDQPTTTSVSDDIALFDVAELKRTLVSDYNLDSPSAEKAIRLAKITKVETLMLSDLCEYNASLLCTPLFNRKILFKATHPLIS